MNIKNLFAVLVIALLPVSIMNAQEMDHSRMKQDSTKMEMDHDTTKMDNTYACSMHPGVISDKPGECPKCGMVLVKKDNYPKSSSVKARHFKTIKQYVCTMHPSEVSDNAGKCPKCGMDLMEKKVELNDNEHKTHN